jgi:hypothetical protein
MDVIEDPVVKLNGRCRFGRHHYLQVQDDNPEMRGRSYLRCDRCGKAKDRNEYGKPTHMNVFYGA